MSNLSHNQFAAIAQSNLDHMNPAATVKKNHTNKNPAFKLPSFGNMHQSFAPTQSLETTQHEPAATSTVHYNREHNKNEHYLVLQTNTANGSLQHTIRPVGSPLAALPPKQSMYLIAVPDRANKSTYMIKKRITGEKSVKDVRSELNEVVLPVKRNTNRMKASLEAIHARTAWEKTTRNSDGSHEAKKRIAELASAAKEKTEALLALLQRRPPTNETKKAIRVAKKELEEYTPYLSYRRPLPPLPPSAPVTPPLPSKEVSNSLKKEEAELSEKIDQYITRTRTKLPVYDLKKSIRKRSKNYFNHLNEANKTQKQNKLAYYSKRGLQHILKVNEPIRGVKLLPDTPENRAKMDPMALKWHNEQLQKQQNQNKQYRNEIKTIAPLIAELTAAQTGGKRSGTLSRQRQTQKKSRSCCGR